MATKEKACEATKLAQASQKEDERQYIPYYSVRKFNAGWYLDDIHNLVNIYPCSCEGTEIFNAVFPVFKNYIDDGEPVVMALQFERDTDECKFYITEAFIKTGGIETPIKEELLGTIPRIAEYHQLTCLAASWDGVERGFQIHYGHNAVHVDHSITVYDK